MRAEFQQAAARAVAFIGGAHFFIHFSSIVATFSGLPAKMHA
eukprot:COSAG05_NODE_13759_length_418_cov_33.003135_1_plen_42_part_10